MHSRRFRLLWSLVHKHWALVLLLFVLNGCGTADKPDTVPAAAENGHVTFVQWSDPHLFDAGAAREREGIEEEQLDNWSALHWAVMQTNRLVLEDHRKIDFVVISGDFGLYNVKIEDLPDFKYGAGTSTVETNCQHDAREGPGTPVSMAEAADLVARELRALMVKKVYLVPGNNDLCDEDPRNRYRYAEFVLRLKKAIQEQQDKRTENLKAANDSLKMAVKPAISGTPPSPPQITDLTFTLERLFAAKDPRAVALVNGLAEEERKRYLRSDSQDKPGACRSISGGNVPQENGFCLLGLDSSYFKPHNDDASVRKKIPVAADTASTEAMATLNDQIQTGGTYLLFTHTPDIEDPFRGNTADPGSSWKLPAAAREKWNGALKRDELIAVFAGHFHSTNRQIYPHNFSYVKQLDAAVAKKFWLAPSLAAKYQSGLPAPNTARGIFLFSVTKNGVGGIAPASSDPVEATPIWFSPLNQKPPLPAEDKLATARALEEDWQWDQAAQKYLALTADPALDSTTREIALAGYERAREKMERWWWKSPVSRWFYIHWAAIYCTFLLLLAAYIAYRILRWFKTGRLLKWLLVPRFHGQARLNTTAKTTKDAPSEEFAAQLLVASEQIRKSLHDEDEPFMAEHIPALTPSSSSLSTLLDAAPQIKGGEAVNASLKFLYSVLQTFKWNIDSGIAVFPPDPFPSPAATTPPILQAGGRVSAYAVLQWGWFVKANWLRSATITDHSALSDVARKLAALIAGQAFLRGDVDHRFTKPESFCLFVEGIRWLQLYDDEANKASPSQLVLKQRLLGAESCLAESAMSYPDDLLPRYYLGIIFLYHAQVEQALYLRSLIANGTLNLTTLRLMPPKQKDYLLRAAREFDDVAARVTGELKSYALWNHAQALARL